MHETEERKLLRFFVLQEALGESLTSLFRELGYTEGWITGIRDLAVASMSTKAVLVFSLSLLAIASERGMAQDTTLILTYPGTSGPTDCQFTSPTGVSADNLGRLLVAGTFGTTGCPAASTVSPGPVIVPTTSDWALPSVMAIGQTATVQWAAVNATTCTYNGSAPAGGGLATWPIGGNACAGTGCESLKTVNLTPTQSGTYTFGLTCVGNGTAVSPLRSTSVTANPASIVSGPGDWSVSGWTVGQQNAFNWSATNAASCSFSGSFPSGVTLGSFMSGTSSCSNAGGCASSHPVTLTPSVAGTYSLTLTCQNAAGAAVTSSNSWSVSGSGDTCVAPSGFSRMTSGYAYYQGINTSNRRTVDLTKYEEVFGRASPSDTDPLSLWPGTSATNAGPGIDPNKYVALKFRTTSSGSNRMAVLAVEPTSFQNSGGGTPPKARIAITVSTKCGDFSTTTTQSGGFIPPNCFRSEMISNDSFVMTNNPAMAGYCILNSNTDYYLNMIYAPLPNPSTAAAAPYTSCQGGSPCRVNFQMQSN